MAAISFNFKYIFSGDCNLLNNTITRAPKPKMASTRVKGFCSFIAYFYTIFTIKLNLINGFF